MVKITEAHYNRLPPLAADFDAPSGLGDRCNRWRARTASGQGGNPNHPDSVHGQRRSCCPPGSSAVSRVATRLALTYSARWRPVSDWSCWRLTAHVLIGGGP